MADLQVDLTGCKVLDLSGVTALNEAGKRFQVRVAKAQVGQLLLEVTSHTNADPEVR